MSKTVLKNTVRYFDQLLEEMRGEWKDATPKQRDVLVHKARAVKALQDDVATRLAKLELAA